MRDTRRQPEDDASTGDARSPIFRLLLFGAVVSVILALALALAFHWRRGSTANTSDPYAAVPFRPKVTYDSLNVTVSNTEEEPYVDTRLNLYVGVIVYSVQVGTMHPGETRTRPLRAFVNEQGESFDPDTHKAILLEVRARFGGYDDHKDFPPPP